MNTEVNKRTHCGWNNWRKMPCVLGDKMVPPHVNRKFHTMIVHASYDVRDGHGANDQLTREETASDSNEHVQMSMRPHTNISCEKR